MEARADPARAGSAASWAAIIAGAVVAASVTLVLFTLGSGLGFAEVSPWPGHGAGVKTFVITTAIWLIVMQWASCGIGGYITGRLRTRWHGAHAHEVFFRDTAHGLVTWAVATLLVAATVAASLFSATGGGIQAGAHAAGAGEHAAGMAASAVASTAQGSHADEYGVDKLFRPTASKANGQSSSDARIEAVHIAANAWTTGAVPDSDRVYLAELVAARTGASPAEAQKQVDEFAANTLDMVSKAKTRADAARKSAAQAAIYLSLSMLIGAFIASVSAVVGGRLRDEHL